MKLTKIAAACAALCASQAFAVTTIPGQATTPDDAVLATTVPVYISGSSALQKTLGAITEGMLTDISEYWSDPTGSSYRAYLGRGKTAIPGVTAGTLYLIVDRAKGGSAFGVKPVLSTTATIQFMTVSPSSCGTIPVVAGTATTPPRYQCSLTAPQKSLSGVTDVEAKLFDIPANAGAGDPELAAITLSAAEKSGSGVLAGSQLAVIMGVALSVDLKPSFPKGLSKAQVNSILTGAYTDWSTVVPSPSTALATGPVVGPITICRRKSGSGTQAAFGAYFQGIGCTGSAVSPLGADGLQVFEASSSQGVIDCLNAHTGAIGVLSTESVPSTVAPIGKWFFADLDLTSPVPKTNATAGIYDFWVEQSMSYPSSAASAKGTPTQKAFLKAMFDRSGDPLILRPLAGVAALPLNYDPNAYLAGDVMKGSRQGDTCAATQLFY